MAPTSLFFNGRLTYKPSAPTKVDASALATQGVGSVGLVAVIGSAVGGKPASAMSSPDDFVRVSRSGKERELYRSGDLMEAMQFAFEPCRDPVIRGGAAQVVAMKVNPATQSVAALANALGDAIDLTSRDYGAFTSQIWVTLATGTSKGKRITIGFEDTAEAQDNLGGDNVFTLAYSGGSSGYDTMTGAVSAAGQVTATGARSELGRSNLITTQIANGEVVRISSSNAADSQNVTIWGLDESGDPASETLTLNGTSAVDGAQTWSAVLGVELSAAAAGTVSVVDQATPANVIFDVPASTLAEGAVPCVAMFAHPTSAASLTADGASTSAVILVGRNAANQVVMQKVTLNGTTPVAATAGPVRWDYLILGAVSSSRTVTITQVAVQTAVDVQDTAKKVVDYFNARKQTPASTTYGFTAALTTGVTTYAVSKLDPVTTPVSILTAVGFKADLYALIDWINASSGLVLASKSSGGVGVPDNTTQAVYLSGGDEGTTLFSHWQSALDQLKQIRVNTIVALTSDPAVHAAVAAHCEAMDGIDERDAVVGIMNADLTAAATKTETKQQIVDINSKHVRVVSQYIERYDSSGTLRSFEPYFHAVAVAGAQAGSPVGTPLTRKYLNAIGFSQDSSWNPVDDAEEMLQAALLFCENKDGIGRRWVRNLTSYLVDSNLAFSEASVVHAMNVAAYSYRQAIDAGVGRRGFAGSVNAILGLGRGVASTLVKEGVLTAARNFDAELVLDVMEHSVDLAPIIPINFIPTTIHVVNPAIRASV